MKQNLQLRFSQHLTLTPQLQQSIRLLQLSTVELNQELETVLQVNPLLERVDHDGDAGYAPAASVAATAAREEREHSGDAARDGMEYDADLADGHHWGTAGRTEEEADALFQEPDLPTLRDHLLGQVRLLPLSQRDFTLATLLIDAINEDGYLEQSLDDLADMLPPELEIDPLELSAAAKLVQHLDPPGVAARDLAECLTLQLQALPPDTPALALALALVGQYLPVLAARDYAKLRRALQCADADLRLAQQLLMRLNPRPGADFSVIGTDHYIQHEVVVRKVKGSWVASLNQEAMPRLRINQMYADILKRNRDSSSQYLMSQMQEAKWMIKNIQQRFSTILRVSQAIVDRQRNFFEHGEIAMRPLVLREIAEELGLHESTISRVTTRKYMLTARGVYELKYFFGSHVSTDTGGACSATAIRALIKQMVSGENPRKPLSDNQIADVLGRQGIAVARRTIAKYRESLQVPAANLRKSL